MRAGVLLDAIFLADFRLPDTHDIKRWIMSCGPNATVLEPKEVVEQVLSDVQNMLNINVDIGKLD